MGNKKLNLKIITPEKIVVEKQVDSVYSLSEDGEMGILPDHIPYMTPLKIGVTRYFDNEIVEYISTIGGILQVSDNNVVILTNSAEFGEEIDIPRARAAKERAEARLGSAIKDVDLDRAQIALSRAMARIKAASKSH
ncbi:MAG: F0F1 ATP synthase subunit epsilon [Candidatus Gastranaerophilales bacterium]|nr:F0F1 ATP synthase subunit epsilon [Candidatus Gastranaerophilales bacterium]